ncbi:MAG: threonine synthase [Gemmatimonadetes bacterium]|nr:threonine synthase [Gemmatimonadota bacterium]
MPSAELNPALLDLRCLACGAIHPASFDASTCVAPSHRGERGILDATWDYDRARRAWPAPTARGFWRWKPLLPVAPPAEAILDPGDTPLVAAPRLARRLGLKALWLKDDTRNPTRSFKDRASAVATAIALATGRGTVACASAGNAAISLAGFAASAGLACEVFVPSYATAERRAWIERFGARLHVSGGNYDVAFEECEVAARANGWYNRNCAYNPFLVEGKKTASYEICEQLDRQIPDVVICAVGDGCTLGAIGKGFRDLRALGVTGAIPALVGVQAEAVSPLVARRRGDGWIDDGRETIAASIAVRRPRNAVRVLREIDESNGAIFAVSDDALRAAQQAFAREAGAVVETATAATLAGLEQLAADGQLRGARVVLVLTGARDA